ncbi:MAG TPA: molybdenum cofactor guanylyltransferase [Longimicrobium sp.]
MLRIALFAFGLRGAQEAFRCAAWEGWIDSVPSPTLPPVGFGGRVARSAGWGASAPRQHKRWSVATEPVLQSPSAHSSNAEPLGAILAGGASRRFGAAKALAEVGGRRIVERVRDALAAAVDDVILIANEPELFGDLDLPARGDLRPGLGAAAGIETALRWAMEMGRPGAVCVACDMPFVSPALLRELVRRARDGDADAVVPESTGRRGIEPLCAWYSVACLPAVERALASDERSLHALLATVRAGRIPLAEVRRFGDPEIIFMNVNTPDDHRRAIDLARHADA